MRGTVFLGTAARAFAMASQFVVLLVMSWLLPKSDFGDAMVVFTLYRLLGLGLGTGLGNLVLYHVGRASGDADVDVRLMRSLTLTGLILSVVLMLLAIAGAPALAAAFQKPGLIPWLVHMSPLLVFGTLNFLMAGSLDGRSRITTSIVLTEVIPNAFRLVGFPLVVVLALPHLAIAHILWIAVALPWFWDVRRLLNPQVRGMAPLQAWDLRYAGWFTIYPMATQQLQGIDMLVVGWLFSSLIAADYSLASRIAVYYPFLQYILVRSFAPNAGALHRAGQIEELNAELVDVKRKSIITVHAMVGGVLIAAPLLLSLFGDFEGAMPILLLLALPVVVRSVFAGADAVLRMTGHARASALIALAAAGVIVAGSYVLAPLMGVFALPATMLVSAVALSPFMVLIAARSGIQILKARDLLWIGPPIAAIVAAVFIPQPWVAALLGGGTLLITAATRAATGRRA